MAWAPRRSREAKRKEPSFLQKKQYSSLILTCVPDWALEHCSGASTFFSCSRKESSKENAARPAQSLKITRPGGVVVGGATQAVAAYGLGMNAKLFCRSLVGSPAGSAYARACYFLNGFELLAGFHAFAPRPKTAAPKDKGRQRLCVAAGSRAIASSAICNARSEAKRQTPPTLRRHAGSRPLSNSPAQK